MATAWGRYLEARMEMVAEWTREGKSIEYITQALSVDPGQIRLLRLTAGDHGMLDDPPKPFKLGKPARSRRRSGKEGGR